MSSEMTVITIPALPKEELRKDRTSAYIRVAPYCRVSTDLDEQQNSFDAQCQYYTELINNNPEWQLVKIFADEGVTGTQVKHRTEFLKMMRYARQGKIDMILAKSVSRFARNTVESLNAIRELTSLGISVYFEKENLDTMTQQDEVMLTIFSCLAQAESESISRNVSWGIRRSFEQGKVTLNYKTFLGYEKGPDDKPVIIPEEAETVKMIYSLFLEGHSFKEITNILTEHGRKNAQGQVSWNSEAVSRILKNEKYTGDVLLQKTFVADCISHTKKKNNGELPKYHVSNHHEGIIDKPTFRLVQEELTRRTSKRRVSHRLTTTESGKYSAKYALTEKLFCAECGTPYRRVTWTAKGYKEIKWRCINRLDNGKKFCHNSPSISEDKLHTAIVAALNTFCNEQETVSKVLRLSVSDIMADKTSILPQLEMLMVEKSNELSRLLALSTSGDDLTAFDDRFKQLSNEITAINEQIETEKAKAIPDINGSRELEDILRDISETDHTVQEYEDALTRLLIDRINVIDKTTIEIKFKGGFTVKQPII